MTSLRVGVRTIFLLSLIFVIGGKVPAVRAYSGSKSSPVERVYQDLDVPPDEFVILSNETDAHFYRDFSTSLRWSALEWVNLENAHIPDSVKDKHILLIGEPDSPFTGQIIAELTTPDERNSILTEGQYVILNKKSPWREDRLVIIASGSDEISTKKAAEEALTNLMRDVSDLSQWFINPYESVSREEATDYIQDIQHTARGEELPRDLLAIDVEVKTPLRISRERAIEDVERLFYLLKYGWCGYGYFSNQGDFGLAKKNILTELGAKSSWSPKNLSELIYQNLDFVHDCHLRIGDNVLCRHKDFWYESDLEVRITSDGYIMSLDGSEYRVLSVNGETPYRYLFPSLNAEGSPVYRLGVLSYDHPGPLSLILQNGPEQMQREFDLESSEFHSDEIFGEERIGGIPVIRARSFGDYYRGKELDEFLETANRYKGEPYLILDLRQNSGGNTNWPKGWVTRFTGHKPAFILILSELTNRTTMMGRKNTFDLMLSSYPDEEANWVMSQISTYTLRARSYDNPSVEPSWSSIQFPFLRWIPNETTLIVIIDRNVASAGEGMIMYLYGQVQNVIFVGENSRGALTFGQVSNHRLPNSKLMLTLPIKLNVPPDLIFREERGYEPDLWVPAEHALNYAVTAARSGNISTQVDLPDGYFEVKFIPEKVTRNYLLSIWDQLGWMLFLMFIGGCCLLLFRNKPRYFIALGIFCLPASVIMIAKDDPQGYWSIAYGLTFIFIGVYRHRRKKAQLEPVESPS